MLFCYSSPNGLRHLSYECFIYIKIFYKVRKGSIQPLTKKKSYGCRILASREIQENLSVITKSCCLQDTHMISLKIKHLKALGLQRSESHLNFLQESGMYYKNATDIRPADMDCIVIRNQSGSFCSLLPCSFSFLLCSFHSLLYLLGFSTQLRACGHHLYKILASGPNQPDFLFLTVPLIFQGQKM